MRKRQKRILLALGWYDYRLHAGIAKYAQQQGWHICSDVTKEKVIPWGWEGDGILAWLGAGDDLAEFVVAAKKPTVDFSFRRPHLRFPRVLLDHAAAAQLAVEHFLSRGLANFMFYSDAENWSFEERGQGFVAAVKRAGRDCVWIRWHQAPEYSTGREQWKRKRHWLAAQLQHAPKPLALFAANDEQALEVLEICDSTGLAVPEQVSLIGVDNSLLALEAMRTPITTVETNMEGVGYRGAELLDRLMRGEPPAKEPVRVPPLGLIVRKSSDLLAVTHKGVANSLRFLWENCHRPISVKDLVGIAGMSRRGLYTAFMLQIGRSPGQELHRVRLERAKKLLAEGTHKMDALARMCGYQSVTGFSVTFKQATGLSPRQYRDKMLR